MTPDAIVKRLRELTENLGKSFWQAVRSVRLLQPGCVKFMEKCRCFGVNPDSVAAIYGLARDPIARKRWICLHAALHRVKLDPKRLGTFAAAVEWRRLFVKLNLSLGPRRALRAIRKGKR